MERLDSTPKLLLSRLPSNKARDPIIIMQTPPLNSKLVSIPFQWEEVPGKPRPPPSSYNKIPTAAARRLELPPRLLNNYSSNVKVSPDDDDDDQIQKNMCESKGLFVGLVKDVVREEGKDDDGDCGKSKRMKLGDSFRSFNKGSSIKSQKNGVKICNRVRRSSSFLGISHVTSTLWAGIYGSFKQVVPWRWRQQ